jgi:hypothetical protein
VSPSGPTGKAVDGAGASEAILERTIERGNVVVAEATAREIGRLNLKEALRLLFLYAEHDSIKVERAALCWLGRYAVRGEGRLAVEGAVRCCECSLSISKAASFLIAWRAIRIPFAGSFFGLRQKAAHPQLQLARTQGGRRSPPPWIRDRVAAVARAGTTSTMQCGSVRRWRHVTLVIHIGRAGVRDFLNVGLLLRRQFLRHLRPGNPGILQDICARPLRLVAHRRSALVPRPPRLETRAGSFECRCRMT